MKDLRRLVVTLVIGSFSLAALMGIGALLSGGEFGETEGKVLATTVFVGLESAVVLCYLSLAGHRWAAIGAVGGLVSAVAFVSALLGIWVDWGVSDDGVWRVFSVAAVLAGSLAQVSLLLALGRRRPSPVGLALTLAAVGLLAAMAIPPILEVGDYSDGYWRAFGVVAILDVLGTVVLTAMGAFGGSRKQDDVLTVELEARVRALAAERGVSPSKLVDDALEAYLTLR